MSSYAATSEAEFEFMQIRATLDTMISNASQQTNLGLQFQLGFVFLSQSMGNVSDAEQQISQDDQNSKRTTSYQQCLHNLDVVIGTSKVERGMSLCVLQKFNRQCIRRCIRQTAQTASSMERIAKLTEERLHVSGRMSVLT